MGRSNQFAHPLLLAVGLLLATQSASAIVLVGSGAASDFTKIQNVIKHVFDQERDPTHNEVDPYIGLAGCSFCTKRWS